MKLVPSIGKEDIIRRPIVTPPPRKDGIRINDEIDNREVRLIDGDGLNHGVVPIQFALDKASEAGLDLVEISPHVDPPVCKVLDFGKYKYEQQKRKHEARRNQKVIEIKEVKFRPNIEHHDYDVKMKQVRKFLGEGDKVRLTLRYRGRELAHQEIGTELLARIRNDLSGLIKVEQEPNMEGRQMVMVVASTKS